MIDAGVSYCVSVLPLLADNEIVTFVGSGVVPLISGLADSLRELVVVAIECIQVDCLISGTLFPQLSLLARKTSDEPFSGAPGQLTSS